ncbi:hypothetical protein KEJ37_00135 [Candidatus Bathyarchaeota archaeon]|nr:hypothetical protein [Candidatus Bathyarchaeota archaeon]
MEAEASKSQYLAERLHSLFVARTDVYGVEDKHGWRTERGKLTINHIENHLKGEFTLGVYPFNRKGVIKWLLIDIDYKVGELFYDYMCRKFSRESVILEETGGKGTHVWAFLQPTPLWQIAHKIDEMENETKHRIFPKQREWKSDIIGNFVRLPLGKHHKTGNWSKIVKGDIWTAKPYITCVHRVYDQFGDGNCPAIDGTAGHCQENLCPHMLKRSQRYGR